MVPVSGLCGICFEMNPNLHVPEVFLQSDGRISSPVRKKGDESIQFSFTLRDLHPLLRQVELWIEGGEVVHAETGVYSALMASAGSLNNALIS